YMSPEQASQSPQLDGRSDIYSLGCTLYEMLTGSVPFTGSTAQAVMARHLLDVVPPIRSVRPTVRHALEQAVLTALAKAPADRFATAGQVARALNAPDAVTLDGEGGESIAVLLVADGYHLWSERYDREMTDVFAIQDEIAKAIANRLRVTLGEDGAPLVTPTTDNLDAYHLYLKGRYYLAQRGLGLKKALECFDQALALDPNYALAYAGLADACTVLAEYGVAPPNVVRPKARAAVQRALELAPDLAEVHCASGALAFICDWVWPRAARDLRRAVE